MGNQTSGTSLNGDDFLLITESGSITRTSGSGISTPGNENTINVQGTIATSGSAILMGILAANNSIFIGETGAVFGGVDETFAVAINGIGSSITNAGTISGSIALALRGDD
jgi:hypothetical protein